MIIKSYSPCDEKKAILKYFPNPIYNFHGRAQQCFFIVFSSDHSDRWFLLTTSWMSNVQRASPEILRSTIQNVRFRWNRHVHIAATLIPSLQTQVIWIEQCAEAEVLFAHLHIHTLHRYTHHSSAHKYCMQTDFEFHWLGSLKRQCVAVDFGWNRHRAPSWN